jgi:hypothetical protein
MPELLIMIVAGCPGLYQYERHAGRVQVLGSREMVEWILI